MSKVLRFLGNSYKYDFSLPRILKRNDVCFSSEEWDFSQISYYLNDDGINGIFGAEVDPLRLDWLDIAMATYLADRFSPREKLRIYDSVWKREIEIKIAVHNIEVWNRKEIKSELEELLNFFTDDDWHFEFVQYTAHERIKGLQRELPFRFANPPRIALFSGGLDSFAGATGELGKDPESPFVFVSGATNSRQIGGQRKQIRELAKTFPKSSIYHYRVGFGIHWKKSEHPKEEDSQRTRGFMFMTLGAVTALNAKVTSLEIYENGIGAINLPYDLSQIGTMASQAVNPRAVIKMENFIAKLTDVDFQIKNPTLLLTKGEMCEAVVVRNLEVVVKETFSCDGFPVRTAGKPQCGICTSCLLRRLSLEVAGLAEFDAPEKYLTDLSSISFNPSFNQLNDLKAMEWQFQILRSCLAEQEPWLALITRFPVLQIIISELTVQRGFEEAELQANILRLYKRYCDEWRSFSARHNFLNCKKYAA